jgi:hypothetical protein
MRVNEYREYKLLACVSIILREGCMRVNEYREYELLACVSIILREGCMRVNEYREYELLSCVSILPCEGCMCAGEYKLLAFSKAGLTARVLSFGQRLLDGWRARGHSHPRGHWVKRDNRR